MSERGRESRSEAGSLLAPREQAGITALARRTVTWAWLAAGVGLALLAYRPLIGWVLQTGGHEDLEDVFFQPANTSPGLLFGGALWLLVRRWRAIQIRARMGRSEPWLAAPLLAIAAAAAAWAHYVGAPEFAILSLIPAGVGIGALLGGRPLVSLLLVPSLLLLLALPPPGVVTNAILYPLQMWTAKTSGVALSALGIDSFLSGDRIYAFGRVYQVIESCSGFRIIQTMIMTSILYVDLFYRGHLQSLLIFVVAPIIAIAMNTLRVLTIVFNPHSDIIAIHTLQGLAVIALSVFALSGIDMAFARVIPAGGTRWRRPKGVPRDPEFTPSMIAIAFLVILAALPLAQKPWTPAPRTPEPFLRLPEKIEGWQSKNLPLDKDYLGTVGFRDRVYRQFTNGSDAVDLFVALDDRLDPRRSAVSAKTALPGSGWRIDSRAPVTPAAAATVQAEEIEATQGRDHLLIHWWTVGWHGFWNEAFRAFFHLDRGPLRRPEDILVYRLSTPIEPDLAAARARLDALGQVALPALQITPPPATR